MWRALDAPEHVEVVELGPGRGLFAQDVLDWSVKKFPDFFRALRYVLVENSPALRRRIERTLARHLYSGKAACAAAFCRGENRKGTTSLVPNPLEDNWA